MIPPDTDPEPQALEKVPAAPAAIAPLLKELFLRIRAPNGAEVEIPLADIGRTARPILSTKCANCGKKMPWTNDPEQDHHTAQRHAIEECGERAAAHDEQRELIHEFAQQLRREREERKTQPRKKWWEGWRLK